MKPLEAGDPRHIGGYRVLRVLGAGGMGRVYLGRNRGGRIVAIKVVRSEWADDPGFRERFRREVDAARRVGGAWTAPVLDADTEARIPWLVTGYVAGPSVYEAVAERGPLPETTVRTLGAGLAEALDAVHAAGLVHRDIKPSNVLLSLDGPRVIDFGISGAMDASVLTRTGRTVGSPGFMSPEQVDGRDVGPPSDVFSLASVLVFAATGIGPFGEGSGQALMYRIVAQEPRLEKLPASLREIVGACMAKYAASRPTPAELLAVLAPWGTSDLVAGNWLPADLTTALSRRAVEMLELDDDGADDPSGVFVATGAGAPTWDDRVVGPTDAHGAPPRPHRPPPAIHPLGAPSPPGAPDRTRPVWRRPWAYSLAAVVIVGVAVAALLIGLKDDDKGDRGDMANTGGSLSTGTPSPGTETSAPPGGSGAPTPSPTGSPTTSGGAPTGGSGSLPTDYRGTWSGSTTSRYGSVAQVTVTLTGGGVGETVGTSALTATGLLGERADCGADLELLSVSEESGVRLTSHLTRNSGCMDGEVILVRESATTMSYVSPGNGIGTTTSEGTLTRSDG